MFNKIKAFRERTREAYNKEYMDRPEGWKQKVMDLHDRSVFLFYYEDCEAEKEDGSRLMIRGELAKAPEKGPGEGPLPLCLYDGQARLIGEGLMLSDPYEKEEKRRAFLRLRKQGFLLEITRLRGRDFSAMSRKEKDKRLMDFFLEISLISDIRL